MKLEFYPLEKLEKEISDITRRYLNPKEYKVFFFGSRVRGDNFPRADIDIGIEGPREIPPEAKFKIEEELENLSLLYKIDIVDFARVSQAFKKEALKHIEYVK